jgi:predicted transcriptional regulator
MREVLISIQPKWVEKICRGEKTVEVRKTKPKLETPFKCYIYCTKGRGDCLWRWGGGVWYETQFLNERPNRLDGKIIGEFVCDRIEEFVNLPLSLFSPIGTLEQTCLTTEQIREYLNGKNGYGWHITDLVVYDNPRELCEFFQVKAIRGYHKKDEPKTDALNIPRLLNSTRFEVNFLTRPPQSWCYIETRQTAD